MEQYISKSALVAEIERRRVSNAKERYFGRLIEDNYFLDFIDTLEVKEVKEEPALTDKVQKIREEVERLQKRAEHNFDISLTENDRQFWLGESNVLTLIGRYIDTMQEEPVSEDLGEYINELSKQFPEVSFAKLSRIAVRVAKWQKEQDKETIELAEDHAMFAGMEKMKEQMMKDAIELEVKKDAGGYPYIDCIELYDYDKDIPLAKEGDMYKVILIKED